MPYNTNITLDDIIDIKVTLISGSTYSAELNACLVITDNAEIWGDKEKVIEVSNLSEVLDLGFGTSDPVYKALSLYFGQEVAPPRAFIGFKSDEETYAECCIACRQFNFDWYALVLTDDMVMSMTKEDIDEVASFVEGASPETIFAITLREQDTKTDETIDMLNAMNYQRTFVQWDNETLNEGKTAVMGIIGYALGLGKTMGYTFTLAYKNVSGISSDHVSGSKLKELLSKNANIYVKQGYYYDLFRQGTMMNGDHFDEIFFLDMIVANLRAELINALIMNPKIPQTEAGVNVLTTIISAVLEEYVTLQFIQPGVWTGTNIMALERGDYLAGGYQIMFENINEQSVIDRAARKAPKCYICIKLAGAIEYITLAINVVK